MPRSSSRGASTGCKPMLLGALILALSLPVVARDVCDVAGKETRPASSLIQVQSRPARGEGRGHRSREKKARGGGGTPCTCESEGNWTRPSSRPPRCVFIDLGAADGNTFQNFLSDGFGVVTQCPSGGDYEAILVEANPRFAEPLQVLQKEHSNVHSFVSSAAYMCEGTTSFFLDTVDVNENFWGSSMSPNHRDVLRSGQEQVTVPTVNVLKLIAEFSLPEDYVLLKIDIEGAEHDILPCLAESPVADLVDALYLEKHPVEWSLGSTDGSNLERSLATLRRKGISIPEYHSPTL